MRRRIGHGGLARVFRAGVVAAVGVVAAGGCASGERAAREREIAVVRGQLDELKKSQDANAKELARLSGEMKALDAQSAFVVGEVKAAAEERAGVKAALEQGDKTVRELKASVEELRKATSSAGSVPAAPPASQPSAPAPQSSAPAPQPSAPALQSSGPSAPDASPEQMYAAALASLQADEHERAVAEFTEVTKKFPEHPLASSAQYWIGEAYYREREFQQALDEFRKVIDGYPKSPQIPEALLKIGLCYRSLQDQARAREAWERVTKQFPGTNAADQARSLLAATSEGPDRPTR